MNVVQHAAMTGDVKVITALTMENIADAAIAADLADRAETDSLVDDLYAFAAQPHTICSTPRIFEVWARRPAATAPSGT